MLIHETNIMLDVNKKNDKAKKCSKTERKIIFFFTHSFLKIWHEEIKINMVTEKNDVLCSLMIMFLFNHQNIK